MFGIERRMERAKAETEIINKLLVENWTLRNLADLYKKTAEEAVRCREATFQRVEKPVVIYCKDCRNLMFSDCYGECKLGHLGIVRPDDYCSRGERRETGGG